MKLEFYTTVTNGQLTKTWQNAVNSFEGQRVAVSIQKAKKKRSNPQNAFYWGVVIPILKNAFIELGYLWNDDATHDFIKKVVAETDPETITEEVVFKSSGLIETRIKSTSELTTTEFCQYVETIQRWSAENLDIYIPDPNEQLTIT